MMRKTIIMGLFLLGVTVSSFGQTVFEIGDFDRVVISPHINLVLIQGDESSVKIEASRVDSRDIKVEVSNDVLSIYLEGARYYEKNERYEESGRRWKEDAYRDAKVTAYVTYYKISSLQVRGDQFVRCRDIIDQNDFKITLYGEVEATFQELRLKELKLKTYGDNEIMVNAGKVRDQFIKCYGDNELMLGGVMGRQIKANLYGDNYLKLNAEDEIRVTSFGDSSIEFLGNAFVSRGIIIGDTDISRIGIN